MANISIDQLANEITKELQQYSQDVIDGIDESSEKIAKNAVKELKSKSPRKTGEYAKGWTKKKTKKYGDINSHVIYNKNKPQLTHLLEHGHAKRGGGRVEGKPHIRPVEEEVIREFTAEVEEAIKNG